MSPIFMALFLVTGWGVFAYSARRRWKLLMVGAPENRFDRPSERLRRTWTYAITQLRMRRYPLAGAAHMLIFLGFGVLLLRTLILWGRGFDESFNFWLFGPDQFLGKAYSLLKDVFAVLVILGTLVFVYYRVIKRLGRMTLSTEGLVILGIILTMMFADILYDGATIALTAAVDAAPAGRIEPAAPLSPIPSGSVQQAAPIPLAPRRFIASGDRQEVPALETKEQGYQLEPDSPLRGMLEGTGTPLAPRLASNPPSSVNLEPVIQPETVILATQYENIELDQRVPFRLHEPAGSLMGIALDSFPTKVLVILKHLGFWTHSTLVLLFLNLLPYSKHFHVITGIPNVYFQNLHSPGRLPPIEDIDGKLEREETLGIRRIDQFSWKSILDLYTCTECGRCSDHCPATKTGKKLSPKHVTLDLRDFLYNQEKALVADKTNGDAQEHRKDLVDGVIDPEVLWACTTCRACEQECPVFISYVDKIVDMRRYLVQERSEFPAQLQTAFRGLESNANPWSFPSGDRAKWAEGLDIKTLTEHPDAEVLFWVGCAPSFDERAKNVTRATVKLMQQAGVDFAILGTQEQCTGDPARRAGNEYLFQMFAKANVEVLNGYAVDKKKIVTTCPHCFNTLLNEYPDFGGKYEVIHHSTFLAGLIAQGKLKPNRRLDKKVVYHDSCYLGRYNEVYDAPREALRSIPGLNVLEPKATRDRGMCCGAGGAQMFKEEEPGKERVNIARTEQLLETQPDLVASACPFCMRMLTDGLAVHNRESMPQLDIAEILLESM